MLADSQIHIWGEDTPERPWAPGGKAYAHGPSSVSAERVVSEMDRNGVDRAILVPPSFEGDRNDLCLEAARRYPERFRVVGRVSLEVPDRGVVEAWEAEAAMVGFRVQFNRGKTVSWLTDGTADWFWRLAEANGIPLYVFAPGSLERIKEVAVRHPRLRLAVDHLGLVPGLAQDEVASQIDILVSLAGCGNVVVKASALPCLTAEAYPFRQLHVVIRRVVDAFGPKRVFWGSDLTRLPCSYRECIAFFTEGLDFLTSADTDWIMGRALGEWFGW